MGKTRTTLLCLLLIFTVSLTVTAQASRDYAITNLTAELSESDSVVLLTVVVTNNGGDATGETTVEVSVVGNPSRVLLSDTLIPLNAGSGVTLEIPFTVELFESDSQQTLEVRVGIDNFELANTPIADDNVATVNISIPERSGDASIVWIGREGDTIFLAGESYTLFEFSMGVLGAVALLMVFWMFTIVVRAIFRSKPRFGAWQPPYGVMPMYDQNTLEGRRWGWQQIAQNSLLLAPPTEGNVHPVKLLMSADGMTLGNWKVTGMRLSQYDVYGRIARTQVIAEKKLVRRMNNILKKRHTVDEAKLQKMLRPITDQMVKQFVKNVRKKTAFLPIAFDMRWEGKHGDVRIIFELYQFSDRAWFRIDQWDPMMQVVSQTMQENYTYTIHGRDASEKMRDFRERLRDDLIWLLLESFRIEPVIEDVTGGQPAVREQYNVPDTLSGMAPVQSEDQPVPEGANS